jgi:signal transduction histidine kinase
LEDHDGSILVGTWDGGLQRVDPVSGLVSRFPAFAEAGSSTSDVSIYTIFRDSSDRVWIGTGAGLDRMIREDSGDWITRVSLGALSRRPGVFGIAEDSGGFLWLSTEDGLAPVRSGNWFGAFLDSRRWTAGRPLRSGAFLKLSDGRFAFGGVEGFNLFHPSTIDMSDAVPQVRIMSLVPLDGQGLTERSSAIPGDGSLLRVPYATSGFSLTLAVLDFTDPGKNVHAIRIEGPRDQRYHLGFSNTAIVPRLAPGKYRFIASGAGNRGVWTENGSSVTVEIVPPFWMRAQFFAVLGLFAAAGIFGAVRLRVSRLEHRTRELRELSAHIHDAREEERTEIAREVHDQLGQTLTAVKMGLYWAKENSRISAETMENRLGELLEYTDLALDSVKSISTRLRPKVLDTLPLDEALGWLIRDFSRWSGVECESRIDRFLRVGPKDQDDPVRVLQENLTTWPPFGASKVWITLVMNDDRIELTVRETGTA